jgi:hypothetical protein
MSSNRAAAKRTEGSKGSKVEIEQEITEETQKLECELLETNLQKLCCLRYLLFKKEFR